MQALKNIMAKEGVSLEGCTLTSTQENSTLVGSKKYIKVTCDSLDRCNSLDQELKSKPHLPWFLSLYPPWKPHRGPQNRNMLNSHSQPNVPSLSSNQTFCPSALPPDGYITTTPGKQTSHFPHPTQYAANHKLTITHQEHHSSEIKEKSNPPQNSTSDGPPTPPSCYPSLSTPSSQPANGNSIKIGVVTVNFRLINNSVSSFLCQVM